MKNKGFADYLRSEKENVDKVASDFFVAEIDLARQTDEEFGEFLETISTLVLRGGKRLRSLMVRLGYGLSGGKENILPVSLFVEFVHWFLLVHDDIADRDLERYGGPTLELAYAAEFKKRFGTEDRRVGQVMAMLAGDSLFSLAHKILHQSGFNPSLLSECELLMNQTVLQTIAGWRIQLMQNFEDLSSAKEAKFLKAMELVSAKYSFETPLLIGANLAGADGSTKKVLSNYALNVGMAFQIQDDILGIFGDSGTTGKPSGNDAREGKKTLLMLRAYKYGRAEQKKFLSEVLGTEQAIEKLDEVKQIIVETGSLEYSKELAKEYSQKAFDALAQINDSGEKEMETLNALARFVVERKY